MLCNIYSVSREYISVIRIHQEADVWILNKITRASHNLKLDVSINGSLLYKCIQIIHFLVHKSIWSKWSVCALFFSTGVPKSNLSSKIWRGLDKHQFFCCYVFIRELFLACFYCVLSLIGFVNDLNLERVCIILLLANWCYATVPLVSKASLDCVVNKRLFQNQPTIT